MTAKSYKNHTLQRINKQDLQSNIRELESLCAVNSSPRKHIANSNATKAFKVN